MPIKFASYNIHKAVGLDRVRDPERIIAVLREVDADVIALQEADLRFGSRASVLPRALIDDTPWRVLPVARRLRSIGWHGNALLVRKGMDCIATSPLDLPTLEPRGAVLAELKVEGADIRVVGTHLDLSGLRRRAQIRALIAECQTRDPLPTVLMGDFNQWGRTSGAMREFARRWRQIPPAPSFPARSPIARLDRIVTTPHWSCRKSGVHHSSLSAVASDHLPVWALLEHG